MQNRTEELLKLKAFAEKHLKEKEGKMNKEDVMQGLEMLSAAQCRFLIQNNSTPQTAAMVGQQMYDYQKLQTEKRKYDILKALCVTGALLFIGLAAKEIEENKDSHLPVIGASAAIVASAINKRIFESKEIDFEAGVAHDSTCENKDLSRTLLQMDVPYRKYVPGSGCER